MVGREVIRPKPRIWRQLATMKVQKGGIRFVSVRMLDRMAPRENDIMSARSQYPAFEAAVAVDGLEFLREDDDHGQITKTSEEIM